MFIPLLIYSQNTEKVFNHSRSGKSSESISSDFLDSFPFPEFFFEAEVVFWPEVVAFWPEVVAFWPEVACLKVAFIQKLMVRL